MKFGLLFRAQDPPDASNLTRRWQDILEAGQLAEEVGFDGLFLPEHHMMDDGYVPAPLVGLGALAAVTKRVDLGTTIMLLPFYNPVQVAEHAAMVDVISGGRMILGVGVGNFEPEFELFGRTSKDQTKLFEESITIVRRLWAGEDVEHKQRVLRREGAHPAAPEGRRPPLDGRDVVPGRAPRGAVRRAVAVRPAAQHPRDQGVDGRLPGRGRGARDLRQALARAPARRLGRGRPRQVERDWWPSIRAEHWFYFSQIPRWVADREPFLQGIEAEDDFKFENHHIDRLVVGSPEQCIDTICRFEDEVANDYLVMSFRVAAGPDHDKEMACIERFGKEVIAGYRAKRG